MKFLFLIAGFWAVSTFTYAQLPTAFEQDLQEILEDGISTYNLKGVEATTIFSGDCSWTGVAGVRDPSNSPVDLIRKWHWGSTGKAMTASIVLQLVDEGLVDINDPIGDYLGVDTIEHLDGEITIKMLLNHTTNLNNSWSDGSNLWNDVFADRDSVWNLWSVLQPEYRDPGDPNPDLVHNYLGYDNYLFLGFLVEEVTGQLLETAYNERIFEPLGFTNSSMGTFGINMDELNGVYEGDSYRGNLAHDSYMSTRGGGGSYVGSSLDIAKFMRAFHNDELVSSELMENARTSTNGEPALVPGLCLGDISQTYGYGTNIIQFDNEEGAISFYGHGGRGLGNCLVLHNIENDFTIALATNDFSAIAQFQNLNLLMDLICYAWDNMELTDCTLNTQEDQRESNLTIYPNPAKTTLKIDTDFNIDAVKVRDMQGRICLTATNVRSIDIEELETGMYILEIFSGSQSISRKWIKK